MRPFRKQTERLLCMRMHNIRINAYICGYSLLNGIMKISKSFLKIIEIETQCI